MPVLSNNSAKIKESSKISMNCRNLKTKSQQNIKIVSHQSFKSHLRKKQEPD